MGPRRRKVVWTREARSTLEEIAAYIARDSLTAAQKILNQALEAAASLSEMAERGRIVPELEIHTIREIIVGRYRMVYEVREKRVEILALIHGARDFAKWRADDRS